VGKACPTGGFRMLHGTLGSVSRCITRGPSSFGGLQNVRRRGRKIECMILAPVDVRNCACIYYGGFHSHR